MTYSRWGRLLLQVLAGILCAATVAHAAPDRLNDDVPDALPDQENAWSFSYSHEAIQLEGPLNDDSIAHDYFKLRYTLNPKTALTFRYGAHNLNGGLGLVNPLFDNRDKGESFTFDLGLNLLNVAAVPADPDAGTEYQAGSAFGVGVSGTMYQMDMGDLNSEDSLLRAYLVYTTDLSPEMRAHTIFTTSRLSGDSTSGSVNRIGAGLDYTLIDGEHPLTLMANGILDVYNFREPDFNTSRVSRFDIGLRYRVAPDWYTSLGYTTQNDSENDASGSGIFASVQYIQEPQPCVVCETPLDAAEAPAEVAPLAALDSVVQDIPAPQPETPAAQQPPMMRSTEAQPAAAEPAAEEEPSAGDSGQENAESPAEAADSGQEPEVEPEPPQTAAEEPDSVAPEVETPEPANADPNLSAQRESSAETSNAGGIIIPPLPDERPHQTAVGAVMIRAGSGVPSNTPQHTSAGDVIVRAPTDPNATSSLEPLMALELFDSDFLSEDTTLLAANSSAVAATSDDAAATDDGQAQDNRSSQATDKTTSSAGG